MRIGIITYYDVTNYGSALQAYAMQEYVKNLGHEVVFLQYERKKIVLPNTVSRLSRFVHTFSPNAMRARKQEEQKRKNVADFRSQHFIIGKPYNEEPDLDCVIVGSDQIFDCKYEFYDYQYAVGVMSDKVFSYAPSFGEFTFEMLDGFQYYEKLKENLSAFMAHSCRDRNTEKIIESLTGVKPTRTLDPTLLYGFEKEKQTWDKNKIKDKYLLIYTWGGTTTTPEFGQAVASFARKNNLKTLSVGDYRSGYDYNYASASPEEFFNLVKNSSMVITNMFHGTCFSIINERPFYSIVMPHNKNKLQDLLQFFNLDSQIVTDVNDLANMSIPSINYVRVNDFLMEQRRISDKYCRQFI